MPIYEYECSKCKNVFEDWCKHVADGDAEHFCPDCKAPASRIISHTSFALKGSGWYATEYGTLSKKKESNGTSATSDTSQPKADSAAAPASTPPAASTSGGDAATSSASS